MEEESHEDIKALVAAYVLGAVPAREEPAIRAHLLTCEECLAEADSYASTASQLALAVEPEAVPPGLEERVLERVRSDRAEAVRPVARRGPRLAWAFGIACLLLAAVLGTAYLSTRGDLAEQERIASALLRGDEGFRLQGEGVAAVVPTEDGAVFVAEGLPDAPEGRVYQLWLLEGPDPVSGGTFDVDEGRAVIDVDRSLGPFDGAAVTLEREGGADAPTTEPVLSSA